MVRDQLYIQDIYKDFKPLPTKFSYGWGENDPNFKKIIHEIQPSLVVEVGTWLGSSACHMAELINTDNMDDDYYQPPKFEIVCVDTWLGSSEFWVWKDSPQHYDQLNLINGYPSVYYQFLSNVINEGWKDKITPMSMPSLQAARIFNWLDLKADMIYIDASHDYEDVLMDLKAWYPLTNKVIFGDDFDVWPGVKQAVKEFCSTNNLQFEIYDRQWVIRKNNETYSGKRI